MGKFVWLLEREANRGGDVGYRWMYLGPADPDFVVSVLSEEFAVMSDADVEAIPVGLAFTMHKLEDATRLNREDAEPGGSPVIGF